MHSLFNTVKCPVIIITQTHTWFKNACISCYTFFCGGGGGFLKQPKYTWLVYLGSMCILGQTRQHYT